MSRAVEESNRRMLRARDAIDRDYQHELDIASLARIALVSERHFLRTFKQTFGETPHRYLQLRRVERAMHLLRHTDLSVTEICLAVGSSSLGSFSHTFASIVGRSPSAYRADSPSAYRADSSPAYPIPSCFSMASSRPTI